MKKTVLFGAMAVLAVTYLALSAESVFAASAASYVASADPAASPDANAGTADAWAVTVTNPSGLGGAGSFFGFGPNWVIWSSPFGNDPNVAGGFVRADHTFLGGPLDVSQAVSIDWANRAIHTGKSVGVSLTSGGTRVVTVKFVGGDVDGVYRYDDDGGTDQSTGEGFMYETLAPLVITLDSATTYSASFNGTPWSGSYTGPIDGIQVFNDAAGDGSDTFFNNLSIVPEPATAGLAMICGVLVLARRRLTQPQAC